MLKTYPLIFSNSLKSYVNGQEYGSFTAQNIHTSAYPFGIIDTGGASSQIAYLPSHMNEGNVKTDVLGGIDTNIIARSFLGYGMYESRSTVEGNVIQRCIDNPNCDTNPKI